MDITQPQSFQHAIIRKGSGSSWINLANMTTGSVDVPREVQFNENYSNRVKSVAYSYNETSGGTVYTMRLCLSNMNSFDQGPYGKVWIQGGKTYEEITFYRVIGKKWYMKIT